MSTITSFGREFMVFSDCQSATKPVEYNSIEDQKHLLVTASGESLLKATKEAFVGTSSLLPYFAEIYNISANMRDYVIVPVIIMPSDLPNRNTVAFPYEELVAANPDTGTLGYQTWRMKPTFVEHINKDYTKAKGIILDAALRPIKGSRGINNKPLYKVLCLCAFDRQRDPMLVNSILTGERNSYSMGALTGHFSCSICGARHGKEAGCEHVSLKHPRMTQIHSRAHKNNPQLAYLKAHNFIGFETSSVKVPAYFSASTTEEQIFTVDNWHKSSKKV